MRFVSLCVFFFSCAFSPPLPFLLFFLFLRVCFLCANYMKIGSIMFHVRRRPADSQPRRRKKKPLGVSNGGNNISVDREGPVLVEVTHTGDGGRRMKLTSEPIEVSQYSTANNFYFRKKIITCDVFNVSWDTY